MAPGLLSACPTCSPERRALCTKVLALCNLEDPPGYVPVGSVVRCPDGFEEAVLPSELPGARWTGGQEDVRKAKAEPVPEMEDQVEQVAEVGKVAKSAPVRVGLDVGFGDVKIAWRREVARGSAMRAITFPAVLGRAEDGADLQLDLSGRRRQSTQVIEYQGQRYFVGDGAEISARMTSARQDAERVGSLEERVLMLAALARAGIDEALIVTGLPVLWWARRQALVQSWRGKHDLTINGEDKAITVREVRPVWQPVGTFYARFLGDDGLAVAAEEELRGGYGIVDVGFNTTDLTGLHDLQPVARWCAGVRMGVRDALEIVSAHVEAEHGARRSLAELSAALRSGQPLQVYDQEISVNGLASSAVHSLAQEIVSQTTRQWGQADRFRRVLVTGGGAALLGDALCAAFPHNAEVVQGPGVANAVGFAKFAQRDIFKATRGVPTKATPRPDPEGEERRARVLDLLAHGPARTQEVAEAMGLTSANGARGILQVLQDEGLVVRTGKAAATRWELAEVDR